MTPAPPAPAPPADAVRLDDTVFRSIVDTTHEGVWLIDTEARMLYANDRLAAMLGCAPEALRGQRVPAFVFAEDAPLAAERIGANLRGESEQFDFRFRRADGTELLVLACTSPVRDRSGRIVGALGMFSDIGERVRAQAALREREVHFRALADAVPGIVWTAAPDGTITYANERWFRYVGITPAENATRWPELVLHPDDRARCVAAWTRALADGTEYEIEVRNRRHDGAYRWFLTRAVPVRDAAGQVSAWSGTTTDIHDRKCAEAEREALLMREQHARAAADREAMRLARLQAATAALARAATPDAVARVVLAEGMAAVGAAAGVVYTLTSDGEHLAQIGAEGYDREVVDEWRTAPLAAETGFAEAVRSGAPIWLPDAEARARRYPHLVESLATTPFGAWCMLPMVVEGRPVGSVAFAFPAPQPFDADDRALLETFAAQAAQALERARLHAAEHAARLAAEAANRAKSEFLAMMSHELRTPLNAITGYVELLELGVRGPVTEAQGTDLARVRRAGNHLLGLINAVLTHAKLEAGQVEFHPEELLVADVLAAIEPLVTPQLQTKRLRYECAPCDPALRARGDREKVLQILVNLVGNAVKFTDRGGVTLATERRGAVIAVSVCDTGRGIPPEKLASIFEPFVQLETRLSRTTEGIGLGLAISRDLAHGMGGDLTAASTPGEGATFTLTLPAV